MKKIVTKAVLLFFLIYIPIVAINIIADPANIWRPGIVDEVVKHLNNGEIVEGSFDMDEGEFQKRMIASMSSTPNTVIIGSSHSMYEEWPFDDYYVAGLSGAYLGDYYAIVGLLNEYDRLPNRIVIGVDPWAFMSDETSGRHQSIKQYSVIAVSLVNGEKQHKNTSFAGKYEFEKAKEMMSFSYFQSSIDLIKRNGFPKNIDNNVGQVKLASSDKMDGDAKILPNGRRVFSSIEVKSLQENNADAEAAIRDNSIYQLGRGFTELQWDNLNSFDNLVQYLQDNGIEVIFYLHPWYPSVYDYFKAEDNYSGVIKTEEYILNMAKEKNIELHGSFDPELCGVNENDFRDWFHLEPDKMMKCYEVIR